MFLNEARVYDSKEWGVGFELETPELTSLLIFNLVTLARSKFSTSLRSLRHIQATGRNFRSFKKLDRSEALPGFMFERLIAGVLNLEGLSARRAPLREDILQQTDIRVRVPGLERQRGERLQVSTAISAHAHQRKQASIRADGEIPVVSPFAIAQGIHRFESLWQDFNWRELWGSLPKLPADIEECSRLLGQVFREACASSSRDPRGAPGRVPSILRLFMCRFVTAICHESHRVLRERIASDPTFRGRDTSGRK